MTFDCPCPDPRLVDISSFAAYGYGESRSFDLRMPVLPIHTAYPTDYRTPQEVLKAAAAAKAHTAGLT